MAVEIKSLTNFRLTPEGMIDEDGNHWLPPGTVASRFRITPTSVRKAIRRETLPAIGIRLHDQVHYYVRWIDAVRLGVMRPPQPGCKRKRRKKVIAETRIP